MGCIDLFRRLVAWTIINKLSYFCGVQQAIYGHIFFFDEIRSNHRACTDSYLEFGGHRNLRQNGRTCASAREWNDIILCKQEIGMTLQLLFAFAGYALVTSITPGPNNTLLLASGANHGFRRTIPLLLGVNLGFSALVLAVGLGLGSLFAAVPILHALLRYGGAAYLLYLAWKIARSGQDDLSGEARRPIGFLEAAAFQWVNPKAWIMAIGAVAAYTPSEGYLANLLLVTFLFALVNAPAITAWAAFGTLLRGFLSNPARHRFFNVTMGLLLAASIYPILFK